MKHSDGEGARYLISDERAELRFRIRMLQLMLHMNDDEIRWLIRRGTKDVKATSLTAPEAALDQLRSQLESCSVDWEHAAEIFAAAPFEAEDPLGGLRCHLPW